jgi:hypothetical protein
MDAVIPAVVGLLALMLLFLIMAFKSWRADHGKPNSRVQERLSR